MSFKDQEPNPLDPRVQRTRQLLQQAFSEMMQEQEFQSITVQDIAARANVNRATFYAHFEDKYALLNYSVREAFQTKLHEKVEGTEPFRLEGIRLLALTVYEFLDSYLWHCSPSARQDYAPFVAMQVQACVQETILEQIMAAPSQEFQQNHDPEVVAMVISWAIFGSGMEWGHSRSNRKYTAEQLADQVLPLITAGLCSLAPEGVNPPAMR